MKIKSPDIERIVNKRPQIKRNMGEGVTDILNKESIPLFYYAQAEAPYKSGKLKNSMDVTINNQSIAITTDVSYADAVYNGSQAHTIYPKDNKALYFNGVFARSAKIPAIPANPYLDKTWERHQGEFINGLETGLANTIEEKVL